MIGGWSAALLGRYFPNQALPGAFTPVVGLESSAWHLAQSASGLLVHPRVVVTVAHAVLFHAGAQLYSAAQVRVELGNVRAWADAVAIPARFLESAGFEAASDLAVLRLPWDVCGPLPALALASARREDFGTWLWGWSQAEPRAQACLPIAVTPSEDGTLRYPATNLPALSGGPLLCGPDAHRPEALLGLHRAFHSDTQQGEAIPFSSEDMAEAMRALGFEV